MRPALVVASLVLANCVLSSQTAGPGSVPSSAVAVQMAPFAGTWLLVGTRQRMIDGSIRPDPDLGPRPSGYLMFDATAGQMCVVMNNGDRAQWKDASKPTDAEARAIWDQTVSYCAAWTVDATRGELVYKLGVNMSPNTIGSERRRRFTLAQDRLILYPTPLPAGVSEWTVEWRKAPARID